MNYSTKLILLIFLLAVLSACGDVKPVVLTPDQDYRMAYIDSAKEAYDAKSNIGKPFVQYGHEGDIANFTVSRSGKYALSSSGTTVILWDVKKQKEIKKYAEHKSEVVSVMFSADEDGFYSIDDKNFYQWLFTEGKINQLNVSKYEATPLTGFAVTPDGRNLLLGTNLGYLLNWSLESKSFVWAVNTDLSNIKRIVCSTDGTKAVTLSDDYRAYLLDVQTGKLKGLKDPKASDPTGRGSWTSHETLLAGMDISTEKDLILTIDSDGILKRWSLSTGKFLGSKKYSGLGIGSFRYLEFSSDGNKFLLVDSDGVGVYDTKSGVRDYSLHVKIKDFGLWKASFVPDTDEFAEVGLRAICFYRMEGDKPIVTKSFKTNVSKISSAQLSRDSRSLLAGVQSVEEGKTYARIWDIVNNKLTHLFQSAGVAKYYINNRYMCTVAGANIYLWDIETQEVSRTFKSHKAHVTTVEFSPDGKYMVSGDTKGFVYLWDVIEGKLVRPLREHKSGDWVYSVDAVGFSPDGRFIGWSTRIDVTVWDTESSKVLSTYKGNHVSTFSFADDNETIAIGSGVLKSEFEYYCHLWKYRGGVQSNIFNTVYWTANKGALLDIEFFEDGTFITCGADGEAIRWNKKHERLNVYDTGGGACTDVSINKDKFVTVNSDNSIRVWQKDVEKEVVAVYTFKDEEWVMITPEGFFDASVNGAKYLDVLIDPVTAVSIDAYYESFYRPDIVAKALAGMKTDTIIDIRNVKRPPSVEIVNTPASTDDKKVTLSVKITDNGGGIGDLRVYRNNTAVVLDGGRALKKTKSSSLKTFEIMLEKGENYISVIAFDAENLVRSEAAEIYITAKFKEIKKPRLHAVVIGANQFRNSKLNLKYAVSDAKLFSSILQKYSGSLFEKVNITLLTAKNETTKERVIAELNKMKNLSPDDLFIFYVASHGTIDNGEYFLITSNVGSVSSRKLREDAMSQNTIKQLISNIPTGKKVIILDTCNSQMLGEAIQVAMLTRGLSDDAAMKVLSRAIGSTILSASTSAQEALEGYKGHGLFTYVLSDGLRGKADADRDGYVKTTELANYIDDTVPELAEKLYKREQFPIVTPSGQAFPISRVK